MTGGRGMISGRGPGTTGHTHVCNRTRACLEQDMCMFATAVHVLVYNSSTCVSLQQDSRYYFIGQESCRDAGRRAQGE